MAAFAGIESWLLLYCRNNWSSLRCTDQEHGLRIRSQYPDDLIFTAAEPFVKLTPIKGKVFRSDSGEPISNSYITVEWQRKSQAFMEIVKLKGFSIEFDRENVKDFDGWAGKRRQVPGKRRNRTSGFRRETLSRHMSDYDLSSSTKPLCCPTMLRGILCP